MTRRTSEHAGARSVAFTSCVASTMTVSTTAKPERPEHIIGTAMRMLALCAIPTATARPTSGAARRRNPPATDCCRRAAENDEQITIAPSGLASHANTDPSGFGVHPV